MNFTNFTISLLTFLFIGFQAFAQNVVIKGNAKSYAGDQLSFCAYADQITHTEKLLAKTQVDQNGDFQFNIPLAETTLAFIHLSVFKGYLFLEPNKEYQIVLPRKLKKLAEDELNPFFKENEFYVRIMNRTETELNSMITNFDTLYYQFMGERFKISRSKYSKSKVDSIIQEIDAKLPATTNEYFLNYKHYKYVAMRFLAYLRNKDEVIKQYFDKMPILYENQGYMDMFDQTLKNYLGEFAETDTLESIKKAIFKEKRYSELKYHFAKNKYVTKDSLREFVILKGLYDMYNADIKSKPEIIEILDSIIATSKIKQHIQIAENFKYEVTQLMIGYSAPVFEFVDADSNMVNLNKFKGKFVYMNFCNLESYTCQEDFDLLQNLANKRPEMLEIVTVLVTDNIQKMKQYVKKHNYKWNILYYNQNLEALRRYNVRAFPAYFMIDPDGKLSMLPAPSPTEKLEQRYFTTLNAWKNEQLRQKAKNKGKDGKK